jgi:hypothetical protein
LLELDGHCLSWSGGVDLAAQLLPAEVGDGLDFAQIQEKGRLVAGPPLNFEEEVKLT